MNIGPTIKKLRKEKGFSQIELSDRVNISQTALSQIENGTTKPHKTTITNICSVLGVPEQVLIILSLENEDVPEDKKLMFDTLYPTIKDFVLKIYSNKKNDD